MRLSERELATLRSLRITDALKASGYIPLRVESERLEIINRNDGSCPYRSDGGCDVHREVGGEHKPSTCQLFPFGMIETPDGVFFSTSFSCPTIVKNAGASLSDQSKELQSLFERTPSGYVHRVDEVRLTEEVTVSWEEYKELESRLLEQETWGHPVQMLLGAAGSVVGSTLEWGAAWELFPSFPQTELFPDMLGLLAVFARNAITILECPETTEDEAELARSLQHGGNRASRVVEGAHLAPFLIYGIPSPLTQTAIDRYIRNQVFGKRLLGSPSLVTRVLTLATAISVFLYYLELHSQVIDEVNTDVLESCFEIIESGLMTHAADLKDFFLEFERAVLTSTLDRSSSGSYPRR